MKIHILDINSISPDRMQAAFAAMARDRQEYCRRLAHERARLLCVAADMAARQLVGDWSKDERGKPICEWGYLSLAHSGDYAVAVHSERPIGVDIEQERPLSPALAKRLGGDEPLVEWLKREAYGKATGEGVYRVLDAPVPSGWNFFFPAAPTGYRMVICEKQESE